MLEMSIILKQCFIIIWEARNQRKPEKKLVSSLFSDFYFIIMAYNFFLRYLLLSSKKKKNKLLLKVGGFLIALLNLAESCVYNQKSAHTQIFLVNFNKKLIVTSIF